MPRRFRRPIFASMYAPRPRARPRRRTTKSQRVFIYTVFVFIVLAAITIPMGLYLRDLTVQVAISETNDLVLGAISEVVAKNMRDGEFEYDAFINLEKDSSGNISAITTNMSTVNELSSKIISEVIEATGTELYDMDIPIGSLFGSSVFMGRGPDIPVRAVMLTSSAADFRNEFLSEGINQTKHRIVLNLTVYVDILVPMETYSNTVTMEVIVAETVIVGQVPDTYLKVN